MADATPSFADFIKETRERKKKETLAQEILGSRGRKANGAGSISNTRNSSQKPSLASRMSSSSGVTKARSSSAKPSPNIDGKWQHDLHKLNNPQGPPNKKPLNRTVSASQVDRNTRAFDKFRTVLQKSAPNPQPSGFSIKGVATGGPITVIGSNFASGTTAADIEAVMAPVVAEGDGEILSCKVISAKPTVIVELSIDKRGAAQNLCDIFNGQRVCTLCNFHIITSNIIKGRRQAALRIHQGDPERWACPWPTFWSCWPVVFRRYGS